MNRQAIITTIALYIEDQKMVINNNGNITGLKLDKLTTYRKHYVKEIKVEQDSDLIAVHIPKNITSEIELIVIVGGTNYLVSINNLDNPLGYGHSSSGYIDSETRANIVRKIAFDHRHEVSKFIEEFDNETIIWLSKTI